MNFIDLLNETFITEERGESLLLLDVDDTLLKANNIFIYRKLPSDKKEVKLTPEQYSKEKVTSETKKYYDYRDFRNADKVARSITTGIPIVSNLKIMDNYINNGWKIGILTARGMEDLIFKSLKQWLKFKNKKGKLEDIGNRLIRDLVSAIGDDTKHYQGKTDFDKKANVIKRLAKQYDRIVFVDDDKKNIEAVKNLGLKNVYVKEAKKW